MLKLIWITFNFIFIPQLLNAQLPKVTSGNLHRIENFESQYVSARNVDVWLPNDYNEMHEYAVLYMHDGQMLFDPETTWNKISWNVDEVVGNLLLEHKIKNTIVVGIWNGGTTRHSDYFPEKPFQSLSQIEKDSVYASVRINGLSVFANEKINSDHYLKFIVEELKPFIDKTYSTFTDPQNTYIAGSSMGGLISLYAICEYPNIFGGAACLSTHWPGIFKLENNPIPNAFFYYFGKNLPDPSTHKIYFDCGDQTLDAMYPSLQKQVDVLMEGKGYTEINWLTKYFPGEDHSEIAWSKRLEIPLFFLLRK